jgi:hypothetical protein
MICKINYKCSFIYVEQLKAHYLINLAINNFKTLQNFSSTIHLIQGYSKSSIHFQKCILQVILNIWQRAIYRLKGERWSYFHTLQALNVSPACDASDVKSIIQLFPNSSQHVTGNSRHILSDTPLQIIDIRTLRDFLSIRTQDMDFGSVVSVK